MVTVPLLVPDTGLRVNHAALSDVARDKVPRRVSATSCAGEGEVAHAELNRRCRSGSCSRHHQREDRFSDPPALTGLGDRDACRIRSSGEAGRGRPDRDGVIFCGDGTRGRHDRDPGGVHV